VSLGDALMRFGWLLAIPLWRVLYPSLAHRGILRGILLLLLVVGVPAVVMLAGARM
jgi:hypothetical protein